MAYVSLEDDTGAMEMLVFSKTLGECGNYLTEGSVVVVEGRLSVRDEKPPQIMCSALRPIDEAEEQKSPYGKSAHTITGGSTGDAEGKSRIYIRVPSISAPEVTYIRKVLVMFPGTGQLVAVTEDTGKRYGMSCRIHPSLVRELEETLGEANVVVK